MHACLPKFLIYSNTSTTDIAQLMADTSNKCHGRRNARRRAALHTF